MVDYFLNSTEYLRGSIALLQARKQMVQTHANHQILHAALSTYHVHLFFHAYHIMIADQTCFLFSV